MESLTPITDKIDERVPNRRGLSYEMMRAHARKMERLAAEYRRQCDDLMTLSGVIDEHPDDYEGPCACKTCMSYA